MNSIKEAKRTNGQSLEIPQLKEMRERVECVVGKREEIEAEMSKLRLVLRQTNEEVNMTKEDLMSKLMQRAELVAHREELDEAFEAYKRSHG